MFIRFYNPSDVDVIADSKDCYFEVCGECYYVYNKYTDKFFW